VEVDVDGSSDCNNTENVEFTHCIGNYGELQSYILSSQNVLEKHSMKLVKVLLNLSKLLMTCKYLTQLMKGVRMFTALTKKELFVWSTSPIYFLGPKPLRYQSLLAVNVQQNRVTVQLPCLCSNVTGKLLSRLTYIFGKEIK